MMADVLIERLKDYRPANAVEQESVLQELMQLFVLASLSRSGFFSVGGFQGGTCLRLLYGTTRFSEDLDFLLKQPDADFRWGSHLERIRSDGEAEGIDVEVQDKSSSGAAVQKAFVKADPMGGSSAPQLPFPRSRARRNRIKLEVDTNPPKGSRFETRYISFPVTAAITTQGLGSGFATKSHALLCRGYTKGRDWYDFLWYVSKRVVPDLPLLGNALDQVGPWAGQALQITPDWYVEALRTRITEIDWDAARQDVTRFIPANEQDSLSLWRAEFFLFHLDRLAEYLQ
jgi:predicted nucleotidyltransferase component of viral defense system